MTFERSDKLTGLPNRRAFDESEPPGPFVAIIDVNGQRHFNDHNGHAAGDILIKRLAEILVSVGLDVYRTGGDEFTCKGDSREDLDRKLPQANNLLSSEPIPADFCFGIGSRLQEAQQSLKEAKRTHYCGKPNP
jgi:predicted signal transduction protein with EAL and GGDEF domain